MTQGRNKDANYACSSDNAVGCMQCLTQGNNAFSSTLLCFVLFSHDFTHGFIHQNLVGHVCIQVSAESRVCVDTLEMQRKQGRKSRVSGNNSKVAGDLDSKHDLDCMRAGQTRNVSLGSDEQFRSWHIVAKVQDQRSAVLTRSHNSPIIALS